ncbi:type III PLP-dependent enzyme [Pseudomaricurvus alkylphenolicus]|uniref:type III PLP-dependent enzyme n=1 Tax=Pseudomaricurvus alkylphenolicus TaxID=1306991 RepID=UPI00142008B7|nr:type III PLP-dependent enzyme [Pseudomaricurvus alkylphenolicus]NIB40092.1 type III PLP-dependent enzyme [Pseudomaricurvus alkylphenolicus]
MNFQETIVVNMPAKSPENLQPVQHQDYCGPELHISTDSLTHQVQAFRKALPGIRPHFAVKANPAPELLAHLDAQGVDFEIASEGELALMQQLGICGKRIIFSNPIKTPRSIQQAVSYGIEWYAFDCLEELQSLQQHAPEGRFELRISTDGKGAVWPLSHKFGAGPDDAEAILKYAAENGLQVQGVTFHVGSQCLDPQAWVRAIERSRELLSRMQELGLKPALLNLGGGFPCQTSAHVPSINAIGTAILSALETLPQGLEIVAEPGRFLVAPAGTIRCQIINTTLRQGRPWAFLDCGYYNGLIEMTTDFGFTPRSSRCGDLCDWVIAGPTCDSIDHFSPNYQLPADSRAGDLIEIPNMGAYSNACAVSFNGFPGPRLIFD